MQCYPDTDILKQFIESSKHVFLKKIAQMRYEELEVIFLGQIFFPTDRIFHMHSFMKITNYTSNTLSL